MVEVTGGGLTRMHTYYPNTMRVRMMENYGLLAVTHARTGRPLSKIYVKVYARMKDGDVRFYKDGYTDLRGKFDYTSLSTDPIDNTERFSILVISSKFGAVVREAPRPSM